MESLGLGRSRNVGDLALPIGSKVVPFWDYLIGS